MYDIVVVGAGPAGSTFARIYGKIAEKRNEKILIIDKRNMEDMENFTHEKCCGGLISPDAQQMLAKFGLGVPKEILVEPQIFTVRTMDMDNNLENYYQRHYININREKFDRWLAAKIPGCVEKEYEAVMLSYRRVKDYYEISYRCKEEIKKVYARNIIGADGGNSKIRKSLMKKDSLEQYIAIQEWFKQEEKLPYYSAIFDASITDYYGWTISKNDELLVGIALKKDEFASEKYKAFKSLLHEKGYELSNRTKREGSFIYRPKSPSDVCTGKGHVYLVGEAAGFISPSSAEGYSYAFRSGYALAKAMEADSSQKKLCHPLYEKRIKTLKTNIFLKTLKSPAMYNPIVRKIAMGSKLMAMNIIDE